MAREQTLNPCQLNVFLILFVNALGSLNTRSKRPAAIARSGRSTANRVRWQKFPKIGRARN